MAMMGQLSTGLEAERWDGVTLAADGKTVRDKGKKPGLRPALMVEQARVSWFLGLGLYTRRRGKALTETSVHPFGKGQWPDTPLASETRKTPAKKVCPSNLELGLHVQSKSGGL